DPLCESYAGSRCCRVARRGAPGRQAGNHRREGRRCRNRDRLGGLRVTRHKKEYPGATPYKDRLGTRRWRFRARGRSFELGTEYGSPEFIRRYEAAQAELAGQKIGQERTKPGTINDLIIRYYPLTAGRWSEATKRTNRAILERFRAEHGHRPVATMKPANMDFILAKMVATPAAAYNLRKRLIPVFRLAMRLGWTTINPAALADAVPYQAGGHHTWSEDEIVRFYAVHEFGSIAHRVMTLMLWTGAARADAVKLGWFSIKNTPEGERLQYTRQKTGRMKNPVLISIPLAPELRKLLETLPRDAGTFLQTLEGKQRSAKALTGDMRKWCDAAGLPECTPHGLRKAIARRMAEAGAAPHVIGAVTGHKTLSEVQRYTEAADRDRLGTAGIGLISGTNPEGKLANLNPKFAKKSHKELK
ncbi:MAG: tyrosine-type recombinase/integrase, partial [Pararhodobacter sp.]